MALDLAGLGLVVCLAAIVIVIIIFLILWFLFKFTVAFFPSIIVALIIWWVSGGNWLYALIAFVVSALIFAAVGSDRRKRRY